MVFYTVLRNFLFDGTKASQGKWNNEQYVHIGALCAIGATKSKTKTPFTLASESVPARVSTLPFVGINANEPRRTVLARHG